MSGNRNLHFIFMERFKGRIATIDRAGRIQALEHLACPAAKRFIFRIAISSIGEMGKNRIQFGEDSALGSNNAFAHASLISASSNQLSTKGQNPPEKGTQQFGTFLRRGRTAGNVAGRRD